MSHTTPALDVEAHVAAVKDLLDRPLSDMETAVGDLSEIPGGNRTPGRLPGQYALVGVERRAVPYKRITGQAGRSSWRLSVQWEGITANNARRVETAVTSVLDEARLGVDGRLSTPLQFDPGGRGLEFDDGAYCGLTVWTYTF